MGFFVIIHNLASLDLIHRLSQVALWSWGWPTVFHMVSLNVFYESTWTHNLIYNLAGKYDKIDYETEPLGRNYGLNVDLVGKKTAGHLMMVSFFLSFGFSLSTPFIGALVPMPWRPSVDFYSAEKLITSFAMLLQMGVHGETWLFLAFLPVLSLYLFLSKKCFGILCIKKICSNQACVCIYGPHPYP